MDYYIPGAKELKSNILDELEKEKDSELKLVAKALNSKEYKVTAAGIEVRLYNKILTPETQEILKRKGYRITQTQGGPNETDTVILMPKDL